MNHHFSPGFWVNLGSSLKGARVKEKKWSTVDSVLILVCIFSHKVIKITVSPSLESLWVNSFLIYPNLSPFSFCGFLRQASRYFSKLAHIHVMWTLSFAFDVKPQWPSAKVCIFFAGCCQSGCRDKSQIEIEAVFTSHTWNYYSLPGHCLSLIKRKGVLDWAQEFPEICLGLWEKWTFKEICLVNFIKS